MDAIDALSSKLFITNAAEESVYKDPVRKVQEEMYAQLLAVREGFALALKTACDDASCEKPDKASQQEIEALRAENAKLKYRVTHLLRALDQK
jgi:hypothetical protein